MKIRKLIFLLVFLTAFFVFSKNLTTKAVDTEAPVITLNGATYVVLERGVNWVDRGATATDNLDGSVTVNVSGTVNTNMTGLQIIAYTATDTAGNASNLTRYINVVSTYSEDSNYVFKELSSLGGSNNDYIYDIKLTSDGGYIVAGYTQSNNLDITDGNHGSDDGLVAKYDKDGQLTWHKTIGGSGRDKLESVYETNDGGYVVAGYSESSDFDITDGNNGAYDCFIIKFDSTGQELWQKTFGGSYNDYFYGVTELIDGSIVAVGNVSSKDFDVTDIYHGISDTIIVKFSSNGQILWHDAFGGSDQEQFNYIMNTEDGGFLAAGYTDSFDLDIDKSTTQGKDALLVKFDSNGNSLWQYQVTGSANENFNQVIQTNDGGYLLVGNTNSNDGDIIDGNNGANDGLLVKLDSNGSQLWQKTFGGSANDYFQSAVETQNGEIIVGGFTLSSEIIDGIYTGYNDALIVKYDSIGQELTYNTFGGGYTDQIESMIQNEDGHVIGAGFSNSLDGDFSSIKKGQIDGFIYTYLNDFELNITGTSNESIEYDETFDPYLNVNAYYNETNINNNLSILGSIDLSVMGSQNLTYQVQYDDYELMINREVNVIDNERPTITLNGPTYVVIEQGASWLDPGASASDFIDGSIPITINGSVDTNTLGDYIIEYIAQDASGNSMIVRRFVSVVDQYTRYISTDLLTTFGGSFYDDFNSVILTNDGGYITVGYTYSSDLFYETVDIKGDVDGLIVKYDAHDNVEWLDTFGGSHLERFTDIIQTPDGGYIVTGYTESNDGDITNSNNSNPDNVDGLLVKYDANGEVEWHKTFGGSGNEYFYSIIYTSLGELVVVGNTDSNDKDITDGNNGLTDVLIVKFDVNGEEIWQKTFGGSSPETAYSVIETVDKGYMLVGYSGSDDMDITDINSGVLDGLIVKVDQSGNVEWNELFGDVYTDVFKKIINTSDGGYVVVGYTQPSELDEANAYIMKFDKSFNKEWNHVLGGDLRDYYTSVAEDGGLILASGFTYSGLIGPTLGECDAFIFAYDLDGNPTFPMMFGGSSYEKFNDIVISPNRLIAVGQEGSNDFDFSGMNHGLYDAFIFSSYNFNSFDITTPDIWEVEYEQNIDLREYLTILDENQNDITNQTIITSNYDKTVGTFTFQFVISQGDTEYIFTRDVTITDSTPPEIRNLSDKFVTLGTTSIDYLSGITGYDIYDGDITGAITVNYSNVNLNEIGAYEVIYTLTDSNGNTTTESIYVYVCEDNEVPTFVKVEDLVIEKGTVSYDWLANVYVIDYIDGVSYNISVDDTAVNLNEVGIYDLIYSYTDSDGNYIEETVQVYVITSLTAPEIFLDQVILTYEVGSVNVNLLDGVIAYDAVDGLISELVTVNGTVYYNQAGTYPVTYRVVNSNGVSTILNVVVEVVDTTPPTIEFENGIDYIIHDVLTPFEEPTVNVVDNYANTEIISVGTVDYNVVGTYTITYYAVDSYGNQSNEITLTVDVVDRIPPLVNLIGDEYMTLQVGEDEYIEMGATASDLYDNLDLTNMVIEGTVDTNTVGSYVVTYYIQDSSGNYSDPVRRVVYVVDQRVPFIELNGDPVITVEYNGIYEELGATATDNYDISCCTVITEGTVDTSTLGTYTIKYHVTDLSGNYAEVTRTVNVVDTTPPTIILNGNDVITIDLGGTYTELGATATDNYDESVTVTIEGSVDTNKAGIYNILYKSIDSNQNESTITRTIKVIDTTAPTVTLNGDEVITIELGETYNDLGVTVVSYDENYTLEIDGTVDTTTIGTYELKYYAIDSNNNQSEIIKRTIHVVDTTPPVITLNGDEVVTIELGETYNDLGVTVHDLNDSWTLSTNGTVDTTTVGTYQITYTVTDSGNNTSNEVTRTVHVVVITPPSITLNGDESITLEVGSTYEELNVSVTNNSSEYTITIDGTVDTNVLGTYKLTYYATDASGNQSDTLTRTVHVVDTEAPRLNGITKEVSIEKGATFNPLEGITANDNYDDTLEIKYSTYYDVNKSGEYIITIAVTDSSGNKTVDYYKLTVKGSKYTITIKYDESLTFIIEGNEVIINEKTITRNRKHFIH